MRDPEKLPEDIKSYLEAENEYYDLAMADTLPLQERLIAEMRGRIKEDDSSVPVDDGAFSYSWRFVEDGEHPIRVRTPRGGGEEEILLDVNKEAEGQEYFELGFVDENPGHTILAWTWKYRYRG